MKRFLALFLSVALLFSLVACGNDTANNSDIANSSSTQSEDKTSSTTSGSNSSDTSSNNSSQTSSSVSTPISSITSSNTGKIEQPKFPVSTTDVYSNQVVRYELNDQCKGYYFTPKAKGKYPTVIIMHGQGNVQRFKERLLSNFNNWVKQGYLPPMVVVMPEVLTSYGPGSSTSESDIDDFQYFIYKSNIKRFSALLKSIEKGTLSPQIDTSIQPYVSGFSMGGMAALHAGAEYRTRIKKIGALSPAKAFYLGEGKYGTYQYASDIQFSKDPDARVYLSAGEAEVDFEGKPGFIESINRYEKAIQFNNSAILTKFVAPASWGGHSFAMAQKEIFMFLYFVTFDKVPDNALVEAICNNPDDYKIPTVVKVEEEHV